MPNPLAPGVYIEEVPFASHLIEAVPTSITGFVAITGRGPLLGPLLSFADFQRVAPSSPGVNLPLAVRGFFENGGQQCFISQIAAGDSLESGLARLDPQAVSILCCPDDATIPNAAAVMAAHCEKRKDRICILQSSQAVVPVTTLRPPVHSSYAVFYYPWITVLSLDRTSSVNSNALNSLGIDVIQSIPVRGITVTGDRTTRQDSDYQFAAVRRLMIFLEQSISRGAQWAVFEPNGPALWVAISSSIQNLLTGVWKMGGLKGSTQPEAFFVRCDLTTMTQNDINNGSLILVVGVAPLQPAEFIFLKITIQT